MMWNDVNDEVESCGGGHSGMEAHNERGKSAVGKENRRDQAQQRHITFLPFPIPFQTSNPP